MVFSSLIFLYLFLPLVLVFHFGLKKQTYRDWVLIVSSLLFYAWGEPVWVVLLIFTSVFDYLNGIIAENYRGRWPSKAALVASIAVNLLLLGFFKYSGFLASNLNQAFDLNLPYKEYGLPIGISFYAFQSISYVIDVYRGEVAAQRSLGKVLLYVSLFHHLVAGPIIRYRDIAREIEQRTITSGTFIEGINRFAVGLGKKVLIANTAGEIADVFLKGSPADLSVLGAWFGVVLFTLQIYFDFSGYSDMAIGLGKMFGFNYKENFNYPYIATSATEFWRRWHISLSSFFRDYVYIPLGGNLKNGIRNLLIVWFLTGLWHGASWNFIFWGLYYGALIMLERVFLQRLLDRFPRWLSHAYLLLAVVVGWELFYFTDLSKAGQVLGVMAGIAGRPLLDINFSYYFTHNLFFLILAVVGCTPALRVIGQKLESSFPGRLDAARPAVNLALLLVSTVFLVGKTYNPFLYFRF
ncbi:MAG: MBOAT family protein [Firmicutes bacterium]|nr:MBOAT family protein [Bacillota bacterium]